MSKLRVTLLGGFAAAALCAAAFGASAADAGKPDFMQLETGWQLNDAEPGSANVEFHPVPGEETRPVTYDLAHPYAGNGDLLKRPPTPRIADLNNPILTPWAKGIMKAANDDVLKTGRFPFTSEQRCWPGGVPGIFLYPAEPVFYLQTPKEVIWFTQRDHQIRRFYLDVPHSQNPGYSWYGESVAHYEHGDTMVTDTIGLDDKGPVDNYRTPHTRALHVTETHQIDPKASRMFINITVEDPIAFTTPWKAWKIYRKATRGTWTESICAENNADYFDERPVPLPEAKRLDF